MSVAFNFKNKKKVFSSGLFVLLNVVYNEVLLYAWSCDSFQLRQLVPIFLFSIGLGGLLAFAVSLIPKEKPRKIVAVILSLTVSVFWITEFFVADAYKVFMSPKLILGGAGGVATDYFDLIISLLVGNLWRIILVLLPSIVYGFFCQCPNGVKGRWRLMAAFAVAGYLAGIGAVYCINGDLDKWTRAFEFDSSVHNYGLHMALILEASQSGKQDQAPDFAETVLLPSEPVQEVPQDSQNATEPEIFYEDNVIESLDFEALSEEPAHSGIRALHKYVSAQTPSKQNQYTGLFEGKNLILITAEAFTLQVVDPELTPTLYRMATEGIEFTDYYQPAWGASTTSGEFSNLIGLVPTTGGMCMKEVTQQDMFVTMGKQLQKLGYMSAAYHNHHYNFYDRHLTHTHLGYDTFKGIYGGLEGVEIKFPESDLQMIDATIGEYIDQSPFSIYYMTVSGHSIYTYDGNYQTRRNYDVVKDLPYSEPIKCYLAAQLEFEYAMKALLGYLEEAGIADDTVIVISTDHYPYGLEKSAAWKTDGDSLPELYGVDEYDFLIRDHHALIIWSGCLEDMDLKVETPVYSLDILPTLSNLFGLDYDSRLLIGRDVFSQQDPLVLWPNSSWKTDKGTYDAAKDIFTPAPGETVSEAYVEYISTIVKNKITYSKSVQDLNYFGVLSKILYPAE